MRGEAREGVLLAATCELWERSSVEFFPSKIWSIGLQRFHLQLQGEGKQPYEL